MAGIADRLSTIDFSQQMTVIAAVSGGSDSTALLVLTSEHLKEKAPTVRLVAVTVDHGLRPESAREAEQVAQLCAQLGIEHFTKRWMEQKPSSGIQSAAREARYDLIGQAAAKAGSSLVLTGHTCDDQVETVLMRKERGEGSGLAGIAPATLAFRDDGGEPIWFARPFLGTTRSELRQELTRRRIAWIDDPSNANLDFERVRVRQVLANTDPSFIQTLSSKQADAAGHRLELSARTKSIAGRHVAKVAQGLYLINSAIALEDDGEAATGALRVMMAFAGGTEHLADAQTACELLGKIRTGVSFRATGSRALIDFRKHGVFVLREDRDVRLSGHIFDSRYVVHAREATPVRMRQRPGLPHSLVAQAQRLEPPQNLQVIRQLLNPWPKRVPLFDVTSASALACLAGEPAFPPAPCSL
jgi:tRNA(Ile)-lysidine synthase